MKTIIWLCWLLYNGDLKDVDSFMDKASCEQFYVASEGRRQQALGQGHPEAGKYAYTLCAPLEVVGPMGKPNT